MRKPSAPRPEPSNRSEGTPASIPPRRSGNRRARPARSGQGGAGQNSARRSPQGPQAQRETEPTGAVGPARRPRAPGASATASSPRGTARTASSKGGARPAVSGKRTGGDSPDASSKSSRSPESAPGAELTVFGRRQVALPRGDDRVVSTGLADRLKERQQALRRLRLRRVTTAAIVVLVVALATWALLLSPLLGLQPQRISVAGSDGSVSDKQVRDVLAPYTGDSLLRLDTGRLSTQVSDKLVRVRQAQVTRSWPRGLRVQLTMRVPVATVQGADGYQVLDNEAVVLERVPEAPSGLVTIVPDKTDGASGSQTISAKQVAAVTQVVGSLTPQTLAQVASGSATEAGQVTLTMSNGASVVWGDTQDNELKARVLATLMTTSASIYDVSSPHRPTTRSADGAASATTPQAS
ncbi:cell division protein FtsQ/DivIB [Actinomyces naeslundii]|uniref:cell division protein FtsQ/DivIB n=1 Tax=Actinomyces naeslundii TaxID=1655 RepID=UPI00096DBBA8|nr:FtsQ-type POTRA domain-containing protein [Actinomyces naeslundii]OMG23319.1 potassium-transporting ATPase subunit B [Actinomyces naeslundii]OMG33426.1 potassium-transporting ATPase subunit B [Actinomyces naeslundii]OMG35623.1 potassium-transporting ATPase subunit B [Actinomyces naeslundii]OMG40103.1 potassium-transporting ATPase subunit B [Actinomyces naeslundii]